TTPPASRERPQPLRAVRDDPTLASAASAEDGTTSGEVEAALRQAFHAEADERDARQAARPAVPPPAPAGDPAVMARFHGPAPGDSDSTLRRAPEELPSANADDGDRPTDEEGTRVYTRDPNDPTV